MGFDDLPEFPQGGMPRSTSGNMGIPPEQFQQALRDTGVDLIQSTKTPEDNPAIAAALRTEVDALAAQMGLATPPAPGAPATPTPGSPDTSATQAPPQAPGFPDTATRGPGAVGDPLLAKIHQVMKKYDDNAYEIAKAYVHTDAARTRAQQERSTDLSALRNELAEVKGMLAERHAPGSGDPQAGATADAGAGGEADAEDFFRRPYFHMRRTVGEVVQQHLTAYTKAQMEVERMKSFDRLRQEKEQDIERLKPIMEDIFSSERDIIERLPQDRALTYMLERAKEREEALKARAYHEEVRAILGGTAPPGSAPTSGGLPSSGAASRVVREPSAGGNWSGTPAFNRLWKARSDSKDEELAIMDILRERGFGETP